MGELEEVSLFLVVLRVIGFVLLYYVGTRGVILLTRRYAGRWYRRALVSLSFAVLFAPSVIGVGAHGGIMPVPAWMAAAESARHGWWSVFFVALGAIVATAILLFLVASLMSKNNNNKADTHGKER
jgi:hypothetical protein